jgi:hypothetical protein
MTISSHVFGIANSLQVHKKAAGTEVPAAIG